MSLAIEAALFEQRGFHVAGQRRIATDLNEEINRLTGERQFAIARGEPGQGPPLLTHGRAQVDQSPDSVDLALPVVVLKRRTELLDEDEHGRQVALISILRPGGLGHSSIFVCERSVRV